MMVSSPSRRSTASVSQTHLAPPPAGSSKPRRMTSPSLPPPSPLDLPEPVVYGQRRPPSPLRSSFTVDPVTGEIVNDGDSFSGDEGQDEWGQRSSSPSPSVAKFAANFAQKVGSLVSNMSARSPNHLPTDEELEAEAERERDRTRREAERILSQEAEAKLVEERVKAMLDDEMRKPLPPPSMPSTPPSPASSNKEGGGWFSVVKQKLTPTKEILTPAQQIIQETKAREKELEKEEKKLEKERKEMEKEMKKTAKKLVKQKSGDWPSSPERKYSDPAFLNLGAPAPPPQPPYLQRPTTPGSPSPGARPISASTPSLYTPPRRSDTGTSSPSRSGPPLYAQFTNEGTLDVPGTLLTIASRFEKLERWTVGHVRALEERMDDVERWLVEKEKDSEHSASRGIIRQQTGEPATVEAALSELRDELAEVQGRIGELGREVAKMVTSPGNLSSGPSRGSASVGRAPSTSSAVAVRSMSNSFTTPPRASVSPNAKETTSPIPPSKSTATGTRLPYPTGDYATPPDTAVLSQGPFSPHNSPPSSMNARARQSISGLPTPCLEQVTGESSPSGLPARATSPPSLPRPPSTTSLRPASVSPTPRKRYTVALGDSIMSADRERERDHGRDRPTTPRSRSQSRDLDGGFLSTSPVSTTISIDTTDESDNGGDETIGKAAARHSGLIIPKFKGQGDKQSARSLAQRPSRPRPQSMYSRTVSSTHNLFAPSPVTPLNTRSRSRSTDRYGLPLNGNDSTTVPNTPTSGKFVDPLETRRRTKEAVATTAPPPPKIMPGRPKVPVGELVAYFNQEK